MEFPRLNRTHISLKVMKYNLSSNKAIKGFKLVRSRPDIKLNLHPKQASPVQFYKAFNIKAFLANSDAPVHLHKPFCAYISDFRGTGESGIMIHGTPCGNYAVTPAPVEYIIDSKTIESKNTRYFTATQLVQYINTQSGINLKEDTKRLHVAACYAGKPGGLADQLATILNKKTVSYSDGKILAISVADILGNKKSLLDDGNKILANKRFTHQISIEAQPTEHPPSVKSTPV